MYGLVEYEACKLIYAAFRRLLRRGLRPRE